MPPRENFGLRDLNEADEESGKLEELPITNHLLPITYH